MKPLVLVWDNFGPIHDDRCQAVALRFPNRVVIGLELGGRSGTYAWENLPVSHFTKITLLKDADFLAQPFWKQLRALVPKVLSMGKADFLFCHYERTSVLVAAWLLRLLGRRVFVMGCSKFDDYERHLGRENLKRIFYSPYLGGIASRGRSIAYMRFLGFKRRPLVEGYNTVSVDRFRALANVPSAPAGTPFAERHFTIVARLVEKKNVTTALEAFALFAGRTGIPRKLVICGNGPLEGELRAQAVALDIADLVEFRSFLQSDGVAAALGNTLALLLPSLSEQFGNVVIEAQALGVPVILSDNAGARELLVRNGVEGFVLEPRNVEGWSRFLQLISDDEALWTRLSINAAARAELGDVRQFAEGVAKLVE
jgi:glycosyltransferase involved in cell wall biosynthesis